MDRNKALLGILAVVGLAYVVCPRPAPTASKALPKYLQPIPKWNEQTIAPKSHSQWAPEHQERLQSQLPSQRRPASQIFAKKNSRIELPKKLSQAESSPQQKANRLYGPSKSAVSFHRSRSLARATTTRAGQRSYQTKVRSLRHPANRFGSSPSAKPRSSIVASARR